MRAGMLQDRRAQSAVMGILILLVLLLLTAGLVDLYRAFAARTWAYSVAQEAALIGVSSARDWETLSTTGEMRLNEAVAIQSAGETVMTEMATRRITDYELIIRVLPEPNGGRFENFPPRPVRLGTGKGDWETNEPAVGVYLQVPVDWVLLDTFGIPEKSVSVFASAGVAQ
jgi:hypothetical protein